MPRRIIDSDPDHVPFTADLVAATESRSFGPDKLQNYSRITNIRRILYSFAEYRRSLPMTIAVTVIGLAIAVGMREVLKHDDDKMNTGMAILLTLCASFVQFAGTQESYSVRSNAAQAFNILEQLCVISKIAKCGPTMKKALLARQAVANGDLVTKTSKLGFTTIVPFEYNNDQDVEMQQLADTNPNILSALTLLSQFDALCRFGVPQTMANPILDMYILTFAFVMPLTIFPIMGYWYVLFSFYPTFVCFGGYHRMCEASNFLSRDIPEYNTLIRNALAILE